MSLLKQVAMCLVVAGTVVGASGSNSYRTASDPAPAEQRARPTLALFPQSSVAGSAAGTNSKVVYAALNGGALQSCVPNVPGTHFVCNVSANGVTITASDELRVVSFG